MSAAFLAMLPGHASPPWSIDENEPGTVFCAEGDPILQVDPHGEMDDLEAMSIAVALITAVNTMAGYAAFNDPNGVGLRWELVDQAAAQAIWP